ncbi:toll/interleukin-1 receptor domain-containing protein [Brevundimonas sp. TWP2-3-4b1]|uniref:toll/interleukin-1 receptor domain-containing protein n=1 Tax=Brevundimonas sp. TWP2-3-4b1 TaxID=2804580 RepID=UPI003CF35C5E
MKRVLTVGLSYSGPPIENVQIETLGLCRASIEASKAAFSLYDYDTIVIDPKSYSHMLFGMAGPFSDKVGELSALKQANNDHDLDDAFDHADRTAELLAAMKAGATVVWCLADPKREKFFRWRSTHLGFVCDAVESAVNAADLRTKKGRSLGWIDDASPFAGYFRSLADENGWTQCLAAPPAELTSIATTPEGYSLGGAFSEGDARGWILTPPTSEASANALITSAISLASGDPSRERYHPVFLSHTKADKPFVRKLRDDLVQAGVRVWFDEAEILVGDSLSEKIAEGLKLSRFIAVVLSSESINAKWVNKELEIAMTREIEGGEVVVLPLLYEKCEIPAFLKGKLYADFTDAATYDAALAQLLHRLRIK